MKYIGRTHIDLPAWSQCGVENTFKQLIWPAAAGNVGWSFISIAVDWPFERIYFQPRLLVLLIVFSYLISAWLRVKAPSNKKKLVQLPYWFIDGLFVASIVVFALAAAHYRGGSIIDNWLDVPLGVVFLTAVVGHSLNLSVKSKEMGRCGAIVGAITNGAGIVFLFVTHIFFPEFYPWNLSVAICGVLVILGIASVVRFRGRATQSAAEDSESGQPDSGEHQVTKVSGEVRINAKRDAVWKVLADLGAVSAWNPTVAKSYYISEAKEGVGSSRHCEFWDGGYVKECATQWEAEKQVRLFIMCSTRPPTFHSLHGVVDSIWSGFTFAMMPRVVSTAA